MKILITGCNGQLGNEMRLLAVEHPNHEYIYSDVIQSDNAFVLDITNQKEVADFVAKHAIDLIVNCAAYTNVDKAEENEAIAQKINAEAVENLAKTGCKLIHISTDYVFAGDACYPYKESDSVSPKTAYGRTKWAGEQVLAKTNAIIFRTAWLYSTFGNNFVKTMLRLGKEKNELGVVFDQIGTPTYAKHLAQAIFQAIESKDWHAGTYHFTNEGVCSWYDFTHEIFRQYNALCPQNPIEATVKPIHSSEYQYRTPRPFYSVLDKQKYKETFGATIPHWTDGLHECLEKLVGEQ